MTVILGVGACPGGWVGVELRDAAAAAWSAHRIARGEAKSIPDPPQINQRERPIAIWY